MKKINQKIVLCLILSALNYVSQACASEASVMDVNSVLIRSKIIESGNKGFCSGVVVDPYTVLTAAHCIENNVDWQIKISGKIYNAASAEVSSERKKSESYSRADIGILHFNQNLTLNSIKVCDEEHNYDNLTRVGFGGRDGRNEKVIANLSGIGSMLKGKVVKTLDPNSVQGDSGGPIFAKENGNDCLYAIHSTLDLVKTPAQSYNPIIRKTSLSMIFY